MCGDSSNNFFEISHVKQMFALSESVMIGGKSTKVTKIMTFKSQWMLRNYLEPLAEFVKILNKRKRDRQTCSSSCCIL